MATFEKNLSKKTRQDGKCEVLIRVSGGRNLRFRIKSGVYVSPSFWDNETQAIVVPVRRKTNVGKVQMAQQEQAALNEYLKNLTAIVNAAQDAGEQLTGQWIDDCFRLSAILNDPTNHFKTDATGSVYTFPNIRRAMEIEEEAIAAAHQQEQEESDDDKPMRIVDAIPIYCERKSISANRTKTYGTLRGQLERFEYYTQLSSDKTFVLDTSTISCDVVRVFLSYLKNEKRLQEQHPRIFTKVLERFPIAVRSKGDKGKQRQREIEERGENHVCGQAKRLAAVCHWLQKEGKLTQDVFENVERPKEAYAQPFYLTSQELDIIADFDMSDQSETLQAQRDVLLFHASVGCRVSDLYALSSDNEIGGFVRYVPAKTSESSGAVCRVPLSKRAKDILERYGGIDGLKQHFCCQQQYNENIRQILSACGITRRVIVRNPTTGTNEVKGINEVATSHTLRKTFCGNAYKSVKDPNLIGAMSGHAPGSKAFARYREIQDDDLQQVIAAMERQDIN